MDAIYKKIKSIPLSYCEVIYRGRKYGLSRTDFNGGKSLKVYAEELGGNDFISFNYYLTASHNHLKPCEMPVEKVAHFLTHFQLIPGD